MGDRCLLITRPRPEADALAQSLAGLGVAWLIEPLLTIEPRPGMTIDLAGVQAVLVTSRNGLRALAAATERRDLPLAAVGDSTAALAREAGFTQVIAADGDVAALATLVERQFHPDNGALLHVSGAAAAGDLAGLLTRQGYACRRQILYDAVPAAALSPAARAALAGGGLEGVVFFSPRTARTFVRLVQAAGLAAACRRVVAYCLSAAVAEAAAALEWRRLAIAEQPTQAALLRLLQDKEKMA